MNEDKKETLGFILLFVIMIGGIILIIFVNSWQNDFKTDRQICEENGGVFVEELSAHNQNQCIYGLKGE
jgi:hypothetical protein